MAIRSDSSSALITGLTGFTGRYLAAELASVGYKVFGTCFNEKLSGDGIFNIDLCSKSDVDFLVNNVQPTIVAHLAGISYIAHQNSEEFYRVNILGTRNLLEALARQSKPPKSVLLASSANVYGNSFEGIISEDSPLLPVNEYGISKLAMEYVARLWMDRLPIIITRPFNYTGVGQSSRFLLPKIVNHFKNRKSVIELGNLDVYRDFSDVRRVAAIYRFLLESAPAGEVFNICSGEVVSPRQILSMMSEIAGYQINIELNTSLMRASDVRMLYGDQSKIMSLNFNLPSYNLIDTMQWMFFEKNDI